MPEQALLKIATNGQYSYLISLKKEIIGTDVTTWFQGKSVRSLLRKHEINAGSWQGELTIRTIKGKLFYAYASAVEFTYKNIQYRKISILDMTDLKSTEFELIKAKGEKLNLRLK